jgi:L-asparaginase
VLLLSSRSPLGQPDSNGLQHLKAAVDFIAEDRYQGVFVPFQNEPGEPVSIYLATRLLEADSWQDRFSSFDGGRLGSMREGHFVYEDTPENPPLASFLKKRDGYRKAPLALPETAPSVMKLHPYPGLDYSRLNLEGVQAVFHGTYHSGTLCTEGEDENGCRFVERAAQAGIPVYFGPVKSGRMQYQSVEGFLQAGAIPVSDCSEIAAYVKLLIGCSLKKRGQQLEQFMQETLYFERMEKSAM